MAQASVDLREARAVLIDAISAVKLSGFRPSHPKSKSISEVMLGDHLTYRYILLTNLLAKATNPRVNALALQAKAEVDGAFDSRSLCHGVVVIADRTAAELAGKLGRSNEPYLNKPARYPLLASTNAVRRGYDQSILERCIDILGSLAGKVDAQAALRSAVYYTLKRDSEVFTAIQRRGDAGLHKILIEFGAGLLERSNEGENCALMTGLSFFLLGKGTGVDYEIKVHPANQAGSSSNEVLDVDVYIGKNLRISAEVKDKIYSFQDVDHAASKVKAAGLDAFFFVRGPQAGNSSNDEDIAINIASKGVRVAFVDASQIYSIALGFAPGDLSPADIWSFIDKSIRGARVKDQTRRHRASIAQRSGLLASPKS